MGKLTLAIFCTLGLASPALAGGIQVDDARAEMMEGQTDRGDIFLSITNTGSASDRLFAVKTSVARKATLETSSEEDVLKGEEKETTALDVVAGQSLVLSEDGPHIELLDLKAPLVAGDTFTVTLYFENAGPVKAEVVVGEE